MSTNEAAEMSKRQQHSFDDRKRSKLSKFALAGGSIAILVLVVLLGAIAYAIAGPGGGLVIAGGGLAIGAAALRV